MSGRADTIRDLRYVVAELRTRGEAGLASIVENATSEAVAVLQQQADRIAWLEGDVAGWRIRLAECEERHERRLSDAQSEAAARPD